MSRCPSRFAPVHHPSKVVRFRLISSLTYPFLHPRFAVCAYLRVSFLQVPAKTGIFPLVGAIIWILRRRKIRGKRTCEEMLVANTLSTEEAGSCKINRLKRNVCASRTVNSRIRFSSGRVGNLSFLVTASALTRNGLRTKVYRSKHIPHPGS